MRQPLCSPDVVLRCRRVGLSGRPQTHAIDSLYKLLHRTVADEAGDEVVNGMGIGGPPPLDFALDEKRSALQTERLRQSRWGRGTGGPG